MTMNIILHKITKVRLYFAFAAKGAAVCESHGATTVSVVQWEASDHF